MALNEIQALIDRLSPGTEPGDDLENSEEFRLIESLISDAETDWARVEKTATELLGRSHDIRLAVALVGSSLRDPHQGLRLFRASMRLLRSLLEAHGDRAHPQPDPDQPLTALRQRAMAIDELGSPFGTVGDDYQMVARIRLLPLTLASSGHLFTFRDLMILEGELANVTLEDEEKAARKSAFDAAMAQSLVRDRDRLVGLLEDATASLHEVEEMERVFDKLAAGVDGAPRLDLAALKEQLRRVMGPLEASIGNPGADPNGATEGSIGENAGEGSRSMGDQVLRAGLDSSGSMPASLAGVPRGGPDSVHSRADVLVAIRAIQKYYRENEPSSPVPLLLERASRFVNMNFVDIVQDIAGDSVENLQVLFGSNEAESHESDSTETE